MILWDGDIYVEADSWDIYCQVRLSRGRSGPVSLGPGTASASGSRLGYGTASDRLGRVNIRYYSITVRSIRYETGDGDEAGDGNRER